MNIQDQIKRLTELRAQKAAEQLSIQEKVAAEGRTKDAAEREQFTSLTSEIKMIDEELADLKDMEGVQAARAVPAVGGSQAKAAASRGALATGGAPAIHVKTDAEEKFKGQNFTRMVIAKALARMNDASPSAIAAARWGKSNPTLVSIIKAGEVAGGGSGSGEWGAELVQANTQYTGDFIEFLHSMTVFDKLPLRPVPSRVHIKGQDGAATGYWVGESKAIGATAADFSAVSLTPLKVATIAVCSNELLRDSSPSAEMLVRDAIVQAAVQRIDTTFVSATAASNGVSPAGILNGVTAFGSFGTDGDALRADIRTLYGPFLAAKNASGLKFVMNPATAKAIQLMTNALGQMEFPGINVDGGTLLGDPVVTGDNVSASHLILCKPTDIWRIGDMGVEVSVSRDAAIEMNSVPAGDSENPTASSEDLVSMFQSESTAFKVVMPINFAKRRSHAAQFVNEANYGNTVSSD